MLILSVEHAASIQTKTTIAVLSIDLGLFIIFFPFFLRTPYAVGPTINFASFSTLISFTHRIFLLQFMVAGSMTAAQGYSTLFRKKLSSNTCQPLVPGFYVALFHSGKLRVTFSLPSSDVNSTWTSMLSSRIPSARGVLPLPLSI